MADWWQWSQKRENEALTFAVVGVGRFGTAVCRELISNGADVLAADYSEKAIDDLRQLEPSIEARVVDCTDEESMNCLLYTSPSPRDRTRSRMPSSA